MIFPIGDTQVKGGSFPYICYGLLALNILVFLYEWQLQLGSETRINEFLTTYGAIPTEILNGEDLITLITSMFLHGGWMHLIGNMLFLWVFADNIEATIGNVSFVAFYLLGGLAASMAHVYFNMDSTIPTVGASGAISAVLGAYMVMFPRSKIKVLVVLFFRSFHLSALVFLGLWILQQLIAGFGSLGGTAESSGVAWWAHIGGFVFGLIAGFFFKSKVRSAPQYYSR
ncbi:MAG: rhomboid family intramembrane serine protease [Cyclobacteriaceae bacterium]|nr:rhomboid family intramembrane serine protease [Cyclobacteriaceae bacterium]